MLRYYQSGYFTRTLLLAFLAALLWLPAFLMQTETQISENSGPLYQLFLFLIGNNVFVHLSTAFVISIATAFLLNQLATAFGLTERISQLTMLMYILLSSALTTYTVLNPFLLVNFLMLFLLRALFNLGETSKHIPLVFSAALVSGMAALIYLPAAFSLLIIWLSFVIFRIVKWRFVLVSIVGFTIPILYTFTWYFWFDKSSEAMSMLSAMWNFQLLDLISYSTFNAIIGIVILILICFVVVQAVNSLMERNINIRQMLIVTLNFLALTFLLFILFSKTSAASLMMSIPASLILASVFSGLKKSKWYEWSLRLILFLIIANQYINLFYVA